LENATTNLGLAFTLFDPLTTNFSVASSSANSNLVTVSATGTGTNWTLWFAPVTNAFGTNTVSITVSDGTLTNSATVTASIAWVNQAPSFNLALTSYTVSQYNYAVSIASAATNIVGGPGVETNQTVTFVVTNNATNLFVVQPTVTSAGTLSFTPGAKGGTVRIGIQAVDNGGTLNGGKNTSASQILTIVIPVNAFPYAKGSYTGLFYDTNAPALDSAGYFHLVLTNDGSFKGYLLCAGTSNVFDGQFVISNSAATVVANDYNLNLTFDFALNSSQSISGSISNTASAWNVPLQSYLPGYSASFETPVAGTHLAAMAGLEDASDGPAGDSVFSLVIAPDGIVQLTGYLADDTEVSSSGALSVENNYPVYLPLYNDSASGLLIGWLNFISSDKDSLTSDSKLNWLCSAGVSTLYPSGFTNTAAPYASTYASNSAAILPFSSGTVVLSGGNLTTPITNTVTIADNKITTDPAATNGLSLKIIAGTGEIQGWFVLPDNQTNSIESVILQSVPAASGYFSSHNQCGLFQLFSN
jgi:hypothetical protein